MKRMTFVIGVLLATFILSVGTTVSAGTTWYTYRDDITVASGSTDIDAVVVGLGYAPAAPGLTTAGNVTLPCNIDNLSAMFFNVSNTAGETIMYNLTVNTKVLNASDTIADDGENATTKAHYVSASGDVTLTYLAWSFNASADVSFNLTLMADDATLTSSWLSSSLTFKEKDVTDIDVGTSYASSYWTVNDSCNVSNDLDFALSDISLNVTYPSGRVADGTSPLTVASLASSTKTTRYTQYQKFGPYVYDVEDDSSGTSHEVTVRLKSNEMITYVVDWELTTGNDVYESYFDALDYGSLVVTLNGVEFEEWSEGSIVMEEFTAKTSPSSNIWVFTWTETSVGPPSGRGVVDSILEWASESAFIFPNWLSLTFVVILLVAAILIIAYRKKVT